MGTRLLIQAQLLFLAPDVALDVIEFLRYMGKPADVIALFLLAIGFKYLLIGFYLFCIRKVWSKLNAPAVRLDVEEPLIPNST